ncbi:MAG: hypothetical protein N2116_07355 [Armatimonadetes bacterium]|nr:hypothetical protein [Armatimonadota bacterium]
MNFGKIIEHKNCQGLPKGCSGLQRSCAVDKETVPQLVAIRKAGIDKIAS